MRYWKRSIAFVLALVMILCCLPAAVFAADDEAVIKSVRYDGSDYTPDGKTITLEVPYSFSGSVDLQTALDITYKDSDYKFVTPSPNPRNIKLGESSTLSAIYQDVSTTPAISYTSDYTVTLKQKAFKSPVFNGSIAVRTSIAEDTKTFTRAQFDELYTKNDGKDLGSVVITGGDPQVAVFRLSNREIDTSGGYSIPVSSLNSLSVAAKTPGAFSVSLQAKDTDGTLVDLGAASIDVTVFKASSISNLTGSIYQTEALKLSDLKITDAFEDAADAELSQIMFTSALSYGTLVTNYKTDSSYGDTIAKDKLYSAATLENVTYVPSRSLTAKETETIKYTALDKAGNEFTGTLTINIKYSRPELEDLSATIKQGGVVQMSTLAFANTYNSVGSGTFGYVMFTLPDKNYGRLRYNYKNASSSGTLASDDTEFYVSGSGKSLLSNLYFVPDSDFTGSFYLYYTATNSKESETLTGRIKITVSPTSVSDLSFSVAQDAVYSFANLTNSINSKFREATGAYFSYVRFSLPNSRNGVLYYNYNSPSDTGTKVSTSTKYYRTGSTTPLGHVSFVPNASFSGSFTLNYTVYDANDNGYAGQVEVTVSASQYELGTLSYTLENNNTFKLSASDINTKVKNVTGNNFNYIYFDELPSSSRAVLYYDYSSSGTYGSKVKDSSSDKYYRTGSNSRLVTDISVVPAKDFSGSFEMIYVAYDTDGDEYEGKISVSVKESDNELEDIAITLRKNKTYTFKATDFTVALRELTSSSLSHVIFTDLPETKEAVLYYDYNSTSGNYDSLVGKTDEYYRTGSGKDLISGVTLVPAKDYMGTFLIEYSAFDADEVEYTGVVKITVNDEMPFTDVDKNAYYYDPVKWALDNNITAGTSETKFSPTLNCNRAQVVTFLWRAAGSPESPAQSTSFADVAVADYYYKAVLWAVEKGITNGTSKTTFSPNYAVTRAQVVTFLWRAAGSPDNQTLSGYYDVSKKDYFLIPVRWAKEFGITKGTSEGYFSPNKTCDRGQIVTFLYRYANLKKN